MGLMVMVVVVVVELMGFGVGGGGGDFCEGVGCVVYEREMSQRLS